MVPEARVFTQTSSAPFSEDGTFARPTTGDLPCRHIHHGTDNVRPVSPCCYHSSSADWSWVRHQLDAVVSDSHQADTLPGYSGQLRHNGVLIARHKSIHASTTMCALLAAHTVSLRGIASIVSMMVSTIVAVAPASLKYRRLQSLKNTFLRQGPFYTYKLTLSHECRVEIQ